LNFPGPEIKRPRVFIFDLETTPNLAYVWGKYEQDVIGDFVKERMIMSIAWKFLGEKKVQTLSIPDFYGYNKPITENKKLIVQIHKLFCLADVLVGQNGDNFDIKMANAEFVQYGLKPPPPQRSVDTLKIAKAKFRFNSNKLDDMAARLGIGRKMKTGGFDLWKACMEGKKTAWTKMIKYNKRDVEILEKLYIRFRPWMKNHPNLNMADGSSGCVSCKSAHIAPRGWFFTQVGRKQRYKCLDCGRWMLGKLESWGVAIR